jgi:hypothetical protein
MLRSKVFISYSHKDEKWLKKLQPFLVQPEGGITFWDDTQIKPGSKWQEEIKRALEQTKLAVLLVSQAFLVSDFINDEELAHFLKASEEDGLTILWVAVSPSTWKQSPISKFQSVNDPKKPLSSFSGSKLQSELLEVAQKILKSIHGQQAAKKEQGFPPLCLPVDLVDQVQSQLSEFVTGAQASLYTRAKTAICESLRLLQALRPWDLQADQRDIATLKQTIQRDLNQLVEELGRPEGPSCPAVNQYFKSLMGQDISTGPSTKIEVDPVCVGGTLGLLRVQCGYEQDLVSTLDDERDMTNFRIVVDYITSLAFSWINNQHFFAPYAATPFLGRQLYVLSNALSVVTEELHALTKALDSASIRLAKRRALILKFKSGGAPVSLEDLLSQVLRFSNVEGPELIKLGNKYALHCSFTPELARLVDTLKQARTPANEAMLPPAYSSQTVQRALDNLANELEELLILCQPIVHVITPERETRSD